MLRGPSYIVVLPVHTVGAVCKRWSLQAACKGGSPAFFFAPASYCLALAGLGWVRTSGSHRGLALEKYSWKSKMLLSSKDDAAVGQQVARSKL